MDEVKYVARVVKSLRRGGGVGCIYVCRGRRGWEGGGGTGPE